MTSMWQLSDQMARYRPGPWLEDALCAQIGYTDFFPGKSESAEPAKRICRMCPVRVECGEYAINAPMKLHGVWGGMGAGERRELRRQRGIHSVEEDLVDWHGTEAGDRRHRRMGEKPCSRCLRAAYEVQLARRQARRAQ